MLGRVGVRKRSFLEYRGIIDDALFDEIIGLASRLKGKRVLQINATADGGGVAELLHSAIPLLSDLGLVAEWNVLVPEPGFFDVTKMIHNGLQGASDNLSEDQWAKYEDYNRRLSKHIKASHWDYVIIHDPQPAAARTFLADVGSSKWIWRCHIDSKHANPSYLKPFLGYLEPYDGAIFTMEKFTLAGYQPQHRAFIWPAIDPFSNKNRPLNVREAAKIVAEFGPRPGVPLMTQVSRFDPWKDPIGVITAWQLARQAIPNLQLALVGDSASDDPEGKVVLEQVQKLAVGEKDIHIVANQADDQAVAAFQSVSDVVVQKSLREGFGLTVTEAMWAGTAVVGSDVGGISVQIEDGASGFLINSVEECAERVQELIEAPERGRQMGLRARELVREKFLLPRMIRDDLKFMLEVGDDKNRPN